MITQYVMTLHAVQAHPLYPDSAYRLYAYLLEQLPPDEAQWLHEAGNRGISQYLQYKKNAAGYLWTVNILLDKIAEILCPILDGLDQVLIEQQVFFISHKKSQEIAMEALLTHGITANRVTVYFCAPTAFKQSGRYTIFPQERLILQSLMLRWNETFPACPLQDNDAFDALLAGIHIVDYRLQSTRFLLKNVRIPGFVGSCVLEAKLAPPLLELWNALLSFANFAGIGIKTGIGMGGVQITFHSRN